MALSPAGASKNSANRKTGWSHFRPVQLGVALLLSTGVLSAAAAVAAAREPDPMDAYGPPPAPNSVSITPQEAKQADFAVTASITAADPSIIAPVPPITTEVVAAAPADAAVDATAEEPTTAELPATPTATSSVVESPELVASSWSMDPLPEGEGGTVASSTSIDPITPTSSMVASPQ